MSGRQRVEIAMTCEMIFTLRFWCVQGRDSRRPTRESVLIQ